MRPATTSTITRNRKWATLPSQRSTAPPWYAARAPVCQPRAAPPRRFRKVEPARVLRAPQGMNAFKADIEEIRRRAREKMDEGAVTAFYRADRDKVVDVLNEVLATEIVCTL